MLFNGNIEISLLKGLMIVMIRRPDNRRNVFNKNRIVIFSYVDLIQKHMNTIEHSSIIRKKGNRNKDQYAVQYIYDL